MRLKAPGTYSPYATRGQLMAIKSQKSVVLVDGSRVKTTWVELLTDFLALKGTRAAANAYRQSLLKLAEYLGDEGLTEQFLKKLKRLRALDAVRFTNWLRKYPAPDGGVLADATFSQRLHLLRRVFRFFVAVELLDRNVFDAVLIDIPKRQKKQKRPTQLIEQKKVIAMLEKPNRGTKAGRRDWCMLALMFGGGLRVSEVYGLNVGDVGVTTSGTPFLLLRKTKNGSTQRQSLPEWAWEAFSQLVSQRAGDEAGNDDPLFPFYSVEGLARGRLSIETMRRTFKSYAKEVGIGPVAPHAARATAATMLKTDGFEDRDVAAFLRHTSTTMVETYDKRVRSPETNVGRKLVYSKK